MGIIGGGFAIVIAATLLLAKGAAWVCGKYGTRISPVQSAPLVSLGALRHADL